MSGVDRLDCSECKSTWRDFGKEPPCETCKPQEMLPGSVGPVTVYCQCVGTLPVSPMDAMALRGIADEEKDECLDNVQLIAATVNRLQTKDREKKRNKK